MFSRLFQVVAVCILIVGAVALATPAQAQCTPRTDWPTYTVVRSDTLFSIARRYQTNVVTLAQANCLRNVNILLLGQVLHVPPSTVSPTVSVPTSVATGSTTAVATGVTTGTVTSTTPTAAGVTTTPIFGGRLPSLVGSPSLYVGATYQQFEKGFMIWRGDTGAIWAFFAPSGRVVEFPVSQYGSLPNRPLDYSPGTLFMPLYGFGKVYSNFAEVKTNLGYATTSETGFPMFAVLGADTRTISYMTISLPTRTYLRINLDGSWAATNPPSIVLTPTATTPPAGADFSVGATFQRFENGFMVWRADTNEIDVFIGQTTGQLTVYTQFVYGRLPTRGDLVPPETRRLPYAGFNRVWANNTVLRQQLGWAVGSEVGYTMIVRNQPQGFSLPDGRFVVRQSESVWQAPQLSPLPPTSTPAPLPTVAPTAATAPTTPAPTAESTAAEAPAAEAPAAEPTAAATQ